MLYVNKSGRSPLRSALVALVVTGALGLAAAPAQAVGFYMGAGVGQSDADLAMAAVTKFDKKDTGWKLFVGGRALWFGAELDYLDFGKPNGTTVNYSYKGLAGYGMVFAPIPVPMLDIYAKGGLARVNTHLHVGASSLSSDDTKVTYGAGVQVKLASLAVRAEYEKFKVDGSKPSLLSLSVSKSF